MKKIQREVVTYKDVYVSVDGKEFGTEADCTAWENSYRGTMAASWALIKKEAVNDNDLGIPYSNDDNECYVIKPRNLDDIVVINAYIESVTYGNGRMLTSEHIGKLVVLDFGYDRDFCDAYILEDHVAKITKYIAEVADKFNEEKEEN